ncbi:DoxX family protein [Janibacter alittae]|uniref:DoxX family membrane protein n=1 Tax=Janibacter alittae TaxID=3115209 RepID=A0ABZ2MHG9_9MICO
MKASLRSIAQAVLGAALVFTGTGHLSFARREFQAQVPPWVPLEADTVVLASGVVEIAFGVALVVTWRQPYRAVVGLAAAVLFVAVLPGNIAQLTEHRDAFGLDTDRGRVVRLFFQPVLVVWALWATDAIGQWRRGALPGHRGR